MSTPQPPNAKATNWTVERNGQDYRIRDEAGQERGRYSTGSQVATHLCFQLQHNDNLRKTLGRLVGMTAKHWWENAPFDPNIIAEAMDLLAPQHAPHLPSLQSIHSPSAPLPPPRVGEPHESFNKALAVETINRLRDERDAARKALADIAAHWTEGHADVIDEYEGCGTESLRNPEWVDAVAIRPLVQIARNALASPSPLSAPAVATPPAEGESKGTFQERVQPWMLKCFGAEVSANAIERNHRFLEEALELVQSTGCTKAHALTLVDYVYGRPVGEREQEVGGVMVTLAALCLAAGLDMHQCGEAELARIWTKIDKIRSKRATKNDRFSLLPTDVPAAGDALEEMEQRKDAAYEERNRVVAALAKCFPSGTAKTAIEGWSEDWHGCVYIDLPTGQASWHFHDSQAHLFADLPSYAGKWDGHSTEEKYRRLATMSVPAAGEDARRMREALEITLAWIEQARRGNTQGASELSSKVSAALASVLPTAPAQDATRIGEDNAKLRRLLALAYSGPSKLYGDDGQLFDGSTRPHINYISDSVDEIERKMVERSHRRYENFAALSAPPQATANANEET